MNRAETHTTRNWTEKYWVARIDWKKNERNAQIWLPDNWKVFARI